MIFIYAIIGALIALIKTSDIFLTRVSRICSVIAIGIILAYTLALLKLPSDRSTGNIVQYSEYLTFLFIFLLTFSTVKLLRLSSVKRKVYQFVMQQVLFALTIIIAGGFVRVTIGKSLHLHEVENFFRVSGLPIWLNYFVMACEVFGVLGICLNSTLKAGVYAAAGLLVLMIGATFVHIHNGDPFTDSADAIFMLICLAFYIGVNLRNTRIGKNKPFVS